MPKIWCFYFLVDCDHCTTAFDFVQRVSTPTHDRGSLLDVVTNNGALKMLDVKMTDQMTGHENAGHEIAGHKRAAYETDSY